MLVVISNAIFIVVLGPLNAEHTSPSSQARLYLNIYISMCAYICLYAEIDRYILSL